MNGVQDWQSIHMTLFSWLKYILDRFVCTLFSCYFQFDNLVNESFLSAVYTEKQHPSTIKLNSTRKKLQVVEFLLWKVSIFVWYCLVWFDDHDGDRDCLVDMTVYVPRQSDILKKWKLDQEHEKHRARNRTLQEEEEGSGKRDSTIAIQLVCPKSCIAKNNTIDDTNDNSMNSYHSLDDIEFQPKSPIIIYFHGGGMVLGSRFDGLFILDYATSIYKKPLNSINNPTSHLQQPKLQSRAIILSVEYRLAPECPFPSQVIDCLSAASFSIEKYSSKGHDIHIAGFSAGGNLATVVGMECHRKYPGKVKR
jgi:hypothetical protein